MYSLCVTMRYTRVARVCLRLPPATVECVAGALSASGCEGARAHLRGRDRATDATEKRARGALRRRSITVAARCIRKILPERACIGNFPRETVQRDKLSERDGGRKYAGRIAGGHRLAEQW